MKTIFSDEFKKELRSIGSSIMLRHYSLGFFEQKTEGTVDEDGNFVKIYLYPDENSLREVKDKTFKNTFEGLWEDGILSFTIEEPNINLDTVNCITIYYSNLNEEILGIAGWILPDFDKIVPESLNMCKTTYINLTIPEVICNISTVCSNSIVDFLESKTTNIGVNMFLADEGFINSNNPVTKLSYSRYQSQKELMIVEKPLYLDENGEKVFNTTLYKHYKGITIQSSDILGNQNDEGDWTYYVGNGTSSSIIGSCVYDLYQVSNSTYTLIGENYTEDLTYANLINLNESNNVTINNSSKQILFDSEKGEEGIEIQASISFQSEIGETKGSVITLFSNKLFFNIYFRWTVEYSTNLVNEDGHAVLLFDTPAGSTGWNPDSAGQATNGEIIVYSEKKISPGSIKIVSEAGNQDIFDSYFKITKQDGGYDTLNRKYKYILSISTLQDSSQSSGWFPLNYSGGSIDFCNTIEIPNSESIEKVKFHCIQRPGNILKIVNSNGDEIPNGVINYQSVNIGLLETEELWISGEVNGYSYWEAISNYESESLIFSSSSSGKITDTQTPGTGINIYTRFSGYPFISRTIIFKRIKDNTKGYDPTNWKDLIYCHPSLYTSLTIEIPFPKGTIHRLPVSMYYTPYFYTDPTTQESYPLIIFDANTNFSKTVSKIYPSYSSKVELDWSDREKEKAIFEEYFNCDYSKNASLTITPKKIDGGYGWFPKYEEKPILVKDISYGFNFYCVIRKSVAGTIKLFDSNTNEELNSIVLNTANGRNIFISSTISDTNNYDYWKAVSSDSEINITWQSLGSGGSYKLINNNSNWDNESRALFYTNTEAPDTSNYKFDSLQLRRTSRAYYTNLDIYKDWTNQLCEDSLISIPMSLEGKQSTVELSVLTADSNGTLIKHENEQPLELDYLGIYKLYVRSTEKFRVSIGGNNNKSDGFYFYDISSNIFKPNILMQDESSFDPFGGREICFVYYGGEEGSFKSLEQTLRTYIKIESSSGSIRIPLHRKYFEAQGIPALWTNINVSDDRADKNGNIFINSTEDIKNISYHSNLETEISLSNSEISSSTSISTSYSSYSAPDTYIKEENKYSILSRGYLYHNLQLTNLNSNLESYPIKPITDLIIKNPDSFTQSNNLGFNGERKNYYLYKLLPTPNVEFNVFDKVELSYKGSDSTIFSIKADTGSKYVLEYQLVGGTDWKILNNSVIEDKFSIRREKSYDSEGWEAYIVTEQTGKNREDDNGGDLTIGYLRARCYVPKDEFIQSNHDYTQDEVNSLVGIGQSNNITIVRKDKNHSISSIYGDTSMVSKEGEVRRYTLRLQEGDEIDETKTLKKCPFIKSMKVIGEILEITFKSKVESKSHSLSYEYSGGNYILTSQDLLVNEINSITNVSPIIVLKNNAELSLPINTYQENWDTGLRFYCEGLSDGNPKLFLGRNNEINIEVESDRGEIDLNFLGVNLPTSINPVSPDYRFTEQALKFRCTESSSEISYAISNSFSQSYVSYQNYYYGYNIRVLLPINENTDSSMGPYKIKVSDAFGDNNVTINITVKAKDSFFFKAFSKITRVTGGSYDYDVSSNDSLNTLVFSSSGAIRYPSTNIGMTGQFYVVTDAPDNMVSFNYISSSLYGGTAELSSASYIYFSNSILSAGKLGTTVYNNVKYNIYRVSVTSKVDRWTSRTTTPNFLESPSHKPFKGGIGRLYLNSRNNNYITFNEYHGCCNIELIGPYKVYNSIQLFEEYNKVLSPLSSERSNISTEKSTLVPWIKDKDILINGNDRYFLDNSGDSWKILYNSEVTKYVDFYSRDNNEYNKYTTNSNFLSNTKPNGSYYYHNDTVWINYYETSTNSKYKDEFEDYGYYVPFLLKITRYEWNINSSGTYEITDLSDSTISIITSEGYLPTNTSQQVNIYHDNTMPRGVGNPESIGINNIGRAAIGRFTSSTGCSCIGGTITIPESISNKDEIAGVLLSILPGEFSITSDGAKTNNNHNIIIGHSSSTSPTLCADSITFKFNVNLYNV